MWLNRLLEYILKHERHSIYTHFVIVFLLNFLFFSSTELYFANVSVWNESYTSFYSEYSILILNWNEFDAEIFFLCTNEQMNNQLLTLNINQNIQVLSQKVIDAFLLIFDSSKNWAAIVLSCLHIRQNKSRHWRWRNDQHRITKYRKQKRETNKNTVTLIILCTKIICILIYHTTLISSIVCFIR